MAFLRRLTAAGRRLRELATNVEESREVSRAALDELRAERVATGERHRELQEHLVRVSADVAVVGQWLEAVASQLGTREAADREFRADVIRGLRSVHADEAWHRRHLRTRRTTAEYERAYTEPDPLISVVIPTYDQLELLRSRAIPSILAQSYGNFEIVIVGDGAGYAAADVTAGFEAAPIRFVNCATRGHYPDDPQRRWLVAGAPPFNEGMALARGLWIAPFADDDAMRPDHLSTLLRHAMEHRLEFVYGLLEQHSPDRLVGAFPPRVAHIGLQAALLHHDLSIFELELADAEFNVPSDWGRVERMLRAGVRVGMVDEVVADYYPSARGSD